MFGPQIEKDSLFTPGVQKYIFNVYNTLSLLFAGFIGGNIFGIYTSMNGMITTIIPFLVSVILVIMMSIFNNKTPYAVGVSVCIGLISSSLIETVMIIDRSILIISSLITLVIFSSISIVGYFTPIKNIFYAGSFLITWINMTILFRIFSILFPIETVVLVELYSGILMFMIFILYDTQFMVERAFRNDVCGNICKNDYVFDALYLFLDVINIFMRILTIIVNIKGKLMSSKKRA